MDTLSLNEQALGKLTEGVVLLDDQGRPLSATRASQPWLRRCIEMAPVLAEMIAASKADKLELPAAVDLSESGEDAAQAPDETWLVANARAGHALLIRPRPRDEPGTGAGEERFLTLLGLGVRQEVSRLGSMLGERGQSAADPAPLLRQASDLDTLLGEIGELAELHQRDAVFFEERLSLPGLLREVLRESRQRRVESGISHVLECGTAPPPGPVYGNAHWLKKALHTLIECMVESCPGLGRVQIQLRQFGDFIVLGASAGNGSTAPTPACGDQTAPSRALRMRICRRVIKLHGGRLKLRMLGNQTADEDGGGVVESFTLSLPTGLPERERSRLSCSDCRISFQAMKYARDLATMMAPPPSSTPSHEEGTS